MHSQSGNMATTPEPIKWNSSPFSNKELHSIFIDWTQSLISIENTVTVSTDYEILCLLGW